jgi:peptidylprolyl isomerase
LKKFVIAVGIGLGVLVPAALAQTAAPAKPDPANMLVVELKSGKAVIQLRPDLAPKHVERVKALAKEGFYNGQKFHRVIDGFMAQTGDPTGTGKGGSKLPDLKAEFSQEPYFRGTIGAARTNNPDTANSQFFICFTDSGCSFLKGQYTVWGRVVQGMEHVDKIAKGEPPATPDTMQKVYLMSDVK